MAQFGYTTPGALQYGMVTSTNPVMQKYTLSETATVNTMSIYGNLVTGTARNMQMAIYDTSFNLKGHTNTLVINNATPQWWTVGMSAPLVLAPGDYWLAWWANDDGSNYVQMTYDTPAAQNDRAFNGTYVTWPNPVSTFDGGQSFKFSIYVTYNLDFSINVSDSITITEDANAGILSIKNAVENVAVTEPLMILRGNPRKPEIRFVYVIPTDRTYDDSKYQQLNNMYKVVRDFYGNQILQGKTFAWAIPKVDVLYASVDNAAFGTNSSTALNMCVTQYNIFRTNPNPTQDHVVFFPELAFNVNLGGGLADLPGHNSIIIQSGQDGGWAGQAVTVAHELGHNYGFQHPNPDDGSIMGSNSGVGISPLNYLGEIDSNGVPTGLNLVGGFNASNLNSLRTNGAFLDEFDLTNFSTENVAITESITIGIGSGKFINVSQSITVADEALFPIIKTFFVEVITLVDSVTSENSLIYVANLLSIFDSVSVVENRTVGAGYPISNFESFIVTELLSVQFAPNFGNLNISGFTQDVQNNALMLTRFTLSQDGNIQGIGIYGQSPSKGVVGVIYADAGDYPGALLAQTAVTTLPIEFNWLQMPLLSPTFLAAGTYWVGIANESNTSSIGQTAVGDSRVQANIGAYPTPPNPAPGTLNASNFQYLTYAYYTPSAAISRQINVFQSITITENTTFRAVSFVAVFDSITINESLSEIDIFNPSVFETITITENTTIKVFIAFSIFDAVIVLENVTFSSIVFFSVFDSISILETFVTAGAGVISVFDSVTITESITMQTLNTISVFESISIVDTAGRFIEVAISEVVTIVFVGSISPSLSDSITVTENVTMVINFSGASFFENVSVSEDFQTATKMVISVFDSISITESTGTGTASIFPSVFDSISVIEALVYFGDMVFVGEIISIAIQIGGKTVSVFESVTITESVTIFSSTTSVSIFDSISVLESFTLFFPKLSIIVFDNVTITEIISDFPTVTVSVFDSITLTEFIGENIALAFSISDSITISEVTIFKEISSPDASEDIGVLEFTNINLSFYPLIVFEIVTNIEFVLLSASGSGVSVDFVLISESTALNIPVKISVFDTVTKVETITITTAFSRLVFDSITVTENITFISNLGITVSDIVIIVEAIGYFSIVQVSVSQSVFITEFVQIGNIIPISVANVEVPLGWQLFPYHLIGELTTDVVQDETLNKNYKLTL